MFGLGDLVGSEFDLTELRKEEVQDQLAELADKAIKLKGAGGAALEAVDKAFFKMVIKALVGTNEE